MMLSMRSVFEQLVFEEDWGEITDEAPAYRFDFGNLKLTAAQVTNKHFQPLFLIGGTATTPRTIRMIRFETPIAVESFEQGVALLAHAIGRDFAPTVPTAWLEQGRLWDHLLPWKQSEAAYRGRPQCVVTRDWFRMPIKSLRQLSSQASDEDAAIFSFDGEVLTILAGHLKLPMPAEGIAWERPYAVRLSQLQAFPKRLMHQRILFDIWEGRLAIDHRRFALLETLETSP